MTAPSGTVTFLFTDVEGSTKLWELAPDAMQTAIERHDEIVRRAIQANGGHVFATGGDGFAAAFSRAASAAQAAIEAQLDVFSETWPPPAILRVRMGMHTGEASERDGDYFGPAVNRAARLMAIAHGGQLLISRSTREVLGTSAQVLDLGEHRLRDLTGTEHVFQVCHPSLPETFPPVHSLDTYATNLPVQSTGFVGRGNEIATVDKALAESRLVTVTGVGGVGKTRLALQVAADLLPDYADGAWLVDLAGAFDSAGVEDAVSTALAIAPPSGQPVRKAALTFLSNKTLLLVLDNCEQVLEEVAAFTSDVLHHTSGVKMLATSREALRVDGEQVLSVPSLGVPEEEDASSSPEVLARSDAVRLFVERAQAARADFRLQEDNAAAVVQLCRRLDGIPLAIELAAARVRSMTPAEIAARLVQRFRLLTGGARSAADRHQTLRRAIDWSFDLLDNDERLLLGRLAVCVGGFNLAAAEVVGSGGTIDPFDVDDLLGRLVDKSLVSSTDLGDSSRYRMLETVREYALERLDQADQTIKTRGRHARHYAQWSAEAGRGLKGPQERDWLIRIEDELDNLRTAVTWSLELEDADSALAIILALSLQNLRIEPAVSAWAAEAVKTPGADHHANYPVALAVLGWWRLAEGRPEEGAQLLSDAARLLDRETASPSLVCRVLAPVSGNAVRLGRGEDVGTDASRWLSAARDADDHYEIANALCIIAVNLSSQADPTAHDSYRPARESAEESLAEARRSGCPSAISYSCFTLANLLADSEPRRALELVEESFRCATVAENHLATMVAVGTEAGIASKQGDQPTAARAALRSAELGVRGGHLDLAAGQLSFLASLLALLGESETAAVLVGWVETIIPDWSGTIGVNDPDHKLRLALVGLPGQLGTDWYGTLRARGAAMGAKEMLELAQTKVAALDLPAGNV